MFRKFCVVIRENCIVFHKYCVVFRENCVVFRELFVVFQEYVVVFADMGHRTVGTSYILSIDQQPGLVGKTVQIFGGQKLRVCF